MATKKVALNDKLKKLFADYKQAKVALDSSYME